MKYLVLIMAFLVTACTSELTDAERKAVADAVIAQIALLNEQGVDPVNLTAEQLALLSSGCVIVPVVYPERAAEIADVCAVVQELAK